MHLFKFPLREKPVALESHAAFCVQNNVLRSGADLVSPLSSHPFNTIDIHLSAAFASAQAIASAYETHRCRKRELTEYCDINKSRKMHETNMF